MTVNMRTLPIRIDAAIDSGLAEQRIVGTVTIVLRDSQVVYQRAAGLANRETGTPMQLKHWLPSQPAWSTLDSRHRIAAGLPPHMQTDLHQYG